MLRQGSIVWVNVSDQAGRNPKCRPAVVVTPNEDIGALESVVVAAVTSTFTEPLPDSQIRLPWQHGGHPRTGLNKPCVAVCDWLLEVPQPDVVKVGGICPNRILDEILLRLPKLNDPPDN